MALDLSKLKSRLNSLSNTNTAQKLIWKPSPGDQKIRILPYSHNDENPFIELKFHYNLNNKTYLSPDSFNRPDPIVEFSNKLKKTGDKEEWKFGKKIEPKLRTFVPIIVRGEEAEGVKFWGFGKQVYEELLKLIADPDFGDITDLETGNDITVTFETAEQTGASFPKTSVRPRPAKTPAVAKDNKQLLEKVKNQVNILELFPEPTYQELKIALETYMNSGAGAEAETTTQVPSTDDDTTPAVDSEATPVVENTTQTKKSVSGSNTVAKDVNAAFDTLFNS